MGEVLQTPAKAAELFHLRGQNCVKDGVSCGTALLSLWQQQAQPQSCSPSEGVQDAASMPWRGHCRRHCQLASLRVPGGAARLAAMLSGWHLLEREGEETLGSFSSQAGTSNVGARRGAAGEGTALHPAALAPCVGTCAAPCHSITAQVAGAHMPVLFLQDQVLPVSKLAVPAPCRSAGTHTLTPRPHQPHTHVLSHPTPILLSRAARRQGGKHRDGSKAAPRTPCPPKSCRGNG